MRRRRNAPRPSRDHLGLRPQLLRVRHRRQAAHQASGRLAYAPPMPLARRPRTAAPQRQHVAIKPMGRDVRRIDQRPALFERPTLFVVRCARRFVTHYGHVKGSALFVARLLLPACGEKVGMRGPNRWAQNCSAQNRGNAPSPSLRSTSPRARGEVNRIPFSRRAPRPSYATPFPKFVIARRSEATKQSSGALRTSFVVQRNRATELDCFAALAMTKERKKQIKRKQNADRRVIQPSAPCDAARALCLFSSPNVRGIGSGARSPVGVPPRRLLRRANATTQLQIRASWDLVGARDPKGSNNLVRKTVRFSAGVTRSFLSQSSELLADRSWCRPGVYPRSRPGAEVTSRRPREPLSLRQPASPAGVLYVSEIRLSCI